MKKSIVALSVAAVVAIAGVAFARGGMKTCDEMGPGMNKAFINGPHAEQYKKFVAETMPLRKEMQAKHMEMQEEYIKDQPDTAKITKLQGEVLKLRTQMYEARVKSGLPMGKMGDKNKKKKGRKHGGKGMGSGMGQMAPPPASEPTSK